jgi:anti-sigma-K factor RskA
MLRFDWREAGVALRIVVVLAIAAGVVFALARSALP